MNNFWKSINRIIVLILISALFGVPPVLTQAKPKTKKGQEGQVSPPVSAPISATSTMVTFNVLVHNAKGDLITGLRKENFKVYENDILQEVQFFEPDDSPVSLAFLIEFSRSTSFILQQERDSVAMIVRGLNKEDYCAIVSFGNFPKIELDFTQDREKSLYTLATMNFTMYSGVELINSLRFLLERMAQIKGKKGIVLLATGLSSVGDFDGLLRQLETASVPVYAISLGQHERNAFDAYLTEDTRFRFFQGDYRMRQLAEHSGGAVFYPKASGAFPAVMKDVINLAHHQYLLAYVPPEPENLKKKRTLRVEAAADVDRDGRPDGLKVSCVKGYVLEQR